MKLPEKFTDEMNAFFEAYDVPEEGFWASFDEPSEKGIRISRSKVADIEGRRQILADTACGEDPVNWCDGGYYSDSDKPGKSPYYHAGAVYPQEPSAMLPAVILDARPGDIVLDMCAAPGGKATRIGEDLKGQGVLFANEINFKRSKALLRNIERAGIPNAVILNETPENIVSVLPGFFDKIIIDAPCSGEGMMRRDDQAVRSYLKFGPETVIPIQKDILEAAAVLLKNKGDIVYSTCTFCIDEDEKQIMSFLERHPDFHVVEHDLPEGVSASPVLKGAMRIWPHMARGDGHFCVHLRRDADVEDLPKEFVPAVPRKKEDLLTEFLSDILKDDHIDAFCSSAVKKGQSLVIPAVDEKILYGLKVVKNGIFLGETESKGNRKIFSPSNSFPLLLDRNMIRDDSFISFDADDIMLSKYLKGETVESVPGKKAQGYVVIGVAGYPLGLGKISGGMIKNLYPAAWRME